MNKYIFFTLFLGGLLSSVSADTTHNAASENLNNTDFKQPWLCYTASGAEVRKKQVTEGILPYIVFEGETQPVSVETRMKMSKTPALSVAVIQKGQLDWSAAWGVLQEGGGAVDCASLFQAGSLASQLL